MKRPACPRCAHIHVSTDVVAIGKFRTDGPLGYRARHDGAPLRATRAEAEADACRARREPQP